MTADVHRRNGWLAMGSIVLIALVMMASNVWAFQQVTQTRPAFVELGTPSVLSDTSALCPGDTIEFSVSVRVDRPTLIMRGEQVWEEGNPRAVTPPVVNFTVIARAEDFPGIPRSWTVPDLPPGYYWRDAVFVLPGQAAAASGNRIPFTVKEGCDATID